MEHAYAEWHQAKMDTPRVSSFSSIIMATDLHEVREIEQFNQVEHAPVQYNQQSQQQSFESSRAPSYSHLVNTSSQPQNHHPNTSTTSSSIFLLNLPSPNVPIRLEPHSPILDHLTAAYIAQGPHPQLPHISHAIRDQVQASGILNKHISDRKPFVRTASRRLQAVLGVRNDLPFDLLIGSGENDARNLVLGVDGVLVDLGLGGSGGNGEFVGDDLFERRIGEYLDVVRGNGVVGGYAPRSNQGDMGMQMDFNIDINTNWNVNTGQNPNTTAHQYHLQNQQNQQNLPINLTHQLPQTQNPKISHFFLSSSAAVNPHTGEGLREYLLRRALLTGSKKRECRSISFHDFTPDVRTGEFCSRLLGHFGVDIYGSGQGVSKCDRVEVVELSLPDKNGILHPWLSIFIQKPFLTITSPLKNPSTSTPPNFPSPIPTTWLCLAVPVANITTYPIQSDTSSLFEETRPKNIYGLPTKKIARHQDYDFSFQGIPIFEFSTRKLFDPPSPSPSPSTFPSQPPISDFLSISSLPAYNPKDPYLPFPPHISQNPAHHQNAARKYAHAAGIPKEELHTFGEIMEDESGVDISEELSPNEGIWWSRFYREITRDRIVWERVRRAMGRGRCRVVVKWEEVERGVCGDGGVGVGLGLGMGLEVERGETGSERVMQEIGRRSKRRTRKSRNEAMSQNFGLGVMNPDTRIHTHSTRSELGLGSVSGSGEAMRARTSSNMMSINEVGRSGTSIETQNPSEKMQGHVMDADFTG